MVSGKSTGNKWVDRTYSHTRDELGIEIIFANSPQGKGRIERSFDTLQDRLIPELRLNNISDMASANHYLQNVFIPQV